MRLGKLRTALFLCGGALLALAAAIVFFVHGQCVGGCTDVMPWDETVMPNWILAIAKILKGSPLLVLAVVFAVALALGLLLPRSSD